MSRVVRSASRPYDRAQAMQWLAERCCWPGDCPDFTDETPAGRAAVIDLLRRVCTAMRAAGLRGAWHYSLPLHTELARILQAEEAQLAALREELAAQRGTRGLPATGDGQRPRRPRARNATGLTGDCPTCEALTRAEQEALMAKATTAHTARRNSVQAVDLRDGRGAMTYSPNRLDVESALERLTLLDVRELPPERRRRLQATLNTWACLCGDEAARVSHILKCNAAAGILADLKWGRGRQ